MFPFKNFVLIFSFVFISSCKYDKPEEIKEDGNYPIEVSEIILLKCANDGCHNDISKAAAGGFSMKTWDAMFEGASGGATVIPYRSDFSTVIFFTNTDSLQGLALIPTMPYNSSPLSQQEYLTLKNWVDNGAPDKNGRVKFADNPSREKYYVINRGADVVSVFDASSNLQMRCVTAGIQPALETPQEIHVSPDNQHWYIVFESSGLFQKFNCNNNAHVADLDLGLISVNGFCISPDSRFAYVAGDNSGGKIVCVNLEDMSVASTKNIDNAEATFVSPDGQLLYILPQFGNFILKAPVNNLSLIDTIVLDPSSSPVNTPLLDARSIVFNDDQSKYYVSCQRSDEIRVMQTSNDSLLAIISVGEAPTDIAISSSHSYLFAVCISPPNPGITIVGSVDVIDMNTNTVIKSVVSGHQPRGIVVSEENNMVVVSNRNVSHGGPAAHHASPYGGRNGYITAIDLNTLELIDGFKAEVSVDPFGMAITK